MGTKKRTLEHLNTSKLDPQTAPYRYYITTFGTQFPDFISTAASSSMVISWTIVVSTVAFIAFAIMTFFGCCCSTAWFRGNRGHDNADDNDPTASRQPHHEHFRDVDYGTYDGPASAPHHGDGEASSLASQVSPRTMPTNAAGAAQDASSSVYSQPTNPPTPPHSDTVARAEQSSSAPEVDNAVDDAMNDAELLRAMREALNKIAAARMAKGTGGRPEYGRE